MSIYAYVYIHTVLLYIKRLSAMYYRIAINYEPPLNLSKSINNLVSRFSFGLWYHQEYECSSKGQGDYVEPENMVTNTVLK